jgi:hypothetical protein
MGWGSFNFTNPIKGPLCACVITDVGNKGEVSLNIIA